MYLVIFRGKRIFNKFLFIIQFKSFSRFLINLKEKSSRTKFIYVNEQNILFNLISIYANCVLTICFFYVHCMADPHFV